MSFAQGFAAGSAAAQRGVDMGLAMKKRREQGEYKQKMQSLQSEYDAGLQVQKDFQAQEQANLDAGMALASPTTAGAGALLNNAMPGNMNPQGAQMSPVAPQAGGLAGPGATPQAAMMTPPPATSYQDYQRDMAALAMQYGDNATGISLMSQAAAADRNAQLDAVRRSEYAQDYLLRSNQDARAQSEEERAAATALREENLRAGQAEVTKLINTGVTDTDQFDTLLQKYGPDGLDIDYIAGQLETRRGITKGAIEETMLGIQGDLRDITSTDALLTYYNDSETLSPGYSLKLDRNDKGVLQLRHLNEEGNPIEKDTVNFASEREADLYLRQRAVDPTTAMKSLVERDNKRRSAAAEAALEQSKLATEKYGDDMGYKKEQMKAVASALEKLRDDQTFFMLDPADRDDRIKRVYTDLGLDPPSSLGVPDLEGDAPPPPKGAGLAAIEAAQTARAEAEKGERTVTSEADEILGYKTGRGLFGSADEELFNAGYEAASPEVQAEIDRILEARARRDAAYNQASGRYGLGAI